MSKAAEKVTVMLDLSEDTKKITMAKPRLKERNNPTIKWKTPQIVAQIQASALPETEIPMLDQIKPMPIQILIKIKSFPNQCWVIPKSSFLVKD